MGRGGGTGESREGGGTGEEEVAGKRESTADRDDPDRPRTSGGEEGTGTQTGVVTVVERERERDGKKNRKGVKVESAEDVEMKG